VTTVTENIAELAGCCNIAELAEICLQTQSGETKVNSRHTVNPRKMAKLAPTVGYEEFEVF
jgi:hypothetical protein